MEEGTDVNNDTAWTLATLVVAGIVIAMLLLWVTSAPAKERPEVCLTKQQARHLWPKRHIFWYSSDHCWSNRRGPPHNLKFDPIKDPLFNKAHAEEVRQNRANDTAEHKTRPGSLGSSRAVIKIVKADQFNELDAAADADTFFNAQPFPYRQFVLNLDLYKSTYWHRQIWGLAKEQK